MVVIAGAGIGGLTLARALARGGVRFVVLERAPALQPAGAGIALAPNALRALEAIGMQEPARAAGQELVQGVICDVRGRVLVDASMRDGVGAGIVAMTRTRLQDLLLEAVGAHVR